MIRTRREWLGAVYVGRGWERRLRGRWLIFPALFAMILSSCGTRLTAQEAAGQLRATGLDAAGTTGITPGTGAAGLSNSGYGSTTGDGLTAGSSSAPVIAGSVLGSGASASGGSARSASGGSPISANKAPIVVGMVGDWTGVVGSAYAPARDAAAAWVKMIDAAGGIEGHQINLLVADDGGDGTQDLPIVRQFVEQDHAIAIFNYWAGPAGEASVAQYVDQKHIPVVGGIAISATWNQSPMMFPSTASADAVQYGYAKAMKDAGVTKVGAVYCSEATVCQTDEETWKTYAAQLGLQVVYESAISLAQPDFTANCFQARSAGAQAILPEADGNTVLRFASSCNDQGYKPLFIDGAPGNATPSYLEGTVAVTYSFPWFVTGGTPALIEYGHAIQQYTNGNTGAFSSAGWVSGKMLQAALAHGVSDNPTTQDVLNGLYAFQNQTLGGLSEPLTYKPGAPAPAARCSYEGVVKNGHWVAPAGAGPIYCKP